MIYKKPDKAIRWLRGESSQWGSDQEADILAFLDSLPDEFEILGPWEVAVVWPNGLTRERILWLLAHPFSAHFGELHALAAIAPVEKKKRKVELWMHESWPKTMPPHAQHSGASMFSDGVGGWRKVGECEVDQ